MRKITAILLTLFIVCAFWTGCSKRPEPAEVPEAPETSSEPAAAPSGPVTAQQAADNNAKIKPSDVRTIQFTDLDEGDPIAVIETSAGTVKIRLFPDQTPDTSAAFEELMKNGYYNGQKFGEVVPGYKIECSQTQGGGANFPEVPEYSLALWNFRGAVALSNNGADFMIVQALRSLNTIEELEGLNFPKNVVDQYANVGGAPHQDWKNPVFGMVVEGMDVVDAIASAKIGEDGSPEEPVVIVSTGMEYHEQNTEDEAPEESESSES